MLSLHVGVYAPVAVLTIYTVETLKVVGRRGESATTIFGSGVSKEVGYEPNIHGVPCFAWMGQWQCNVAVDGVDTLHTRVDDSSQEHGVNLETIKRPLLYALNMHRTYMDICGQA